jgi:hypothetical protein
MRLTVKNLQRGLVLSCASLVFISLCACSNVAGVKAWEKGYLANPEMRFDQDKLMSKNTEHVYASKEAAAGGVGVGGGGCGCN